MGKKYIIELEREEIAYKTVNSNGTPMIQLLAPAPYTEPDLEQVRKEAYEKGFKNAVHNCPEGCPYVEQARNDAYQRGYEQGYKDGYNEPGKNQQEAYQRGLNDAWECARKIILDKEDGGLEAVTYNEIFGYGKGVRTILKTFTASEAIAKIRAYEQEKEEIKVGDEVEAMAGNAVVIEIIDDGQTVRYMYPNTITGRNKACNVTRTGRHFPELVELLKKMKETE